MYTYADPRACPSCRTELPADLSSDDRCATCDVVLGHPRAAEVYQQLQRVDTLVARLRAASRQPAPTAPSRTTPPTAPSATPGPVVPPLVVPPPRTGVRTSSVPAILLGLGALCLLVAAVIFLAVAWGWLGVGGRTVVLGALTVATAAGGTVLRGRGLRVAAEALVSVSLGMLVLDVLGADRAGWLDGVGGTDGLEAAGLAVTVGVVLAAGGLVLTQGAHRLVVPQAVGVLGLVLVELALPSVVGHDLVVAALATVGFGALAAATRRVHGLHATAWTAGAGAVLSWTDLVLSALLDLPGGGLSATDLWTSGCGPALLTAAVLILAPLAVTRGEALLQACTIAAASMTTGVVVLPVLDNGTTDVALASLVAGGLWAAAAYAVPLTRLAVPAVPAVLAL
ncbi:MAG: hypothetical protein JWN84_1227, partial [Nocardioides sp.]|nr:hypothetical protein [Nocardioides sp.]